MRESLNKGAVRQILQPRHSEAYAFNLNSNAGNLVTPFLMHGSSRFDLHTVAPLSFGRCHRHISRVACSGPVRALVIGVKRGVVATAQFRAILTVRLMAVVPGGKNPR
jgi:hypothetical protein